MTYLPHESFRLSAHVLDEPRLLRQWEDVLMLLRRVVGRVSWGRGEAHPCVTMWRSHGPALTLYAECVHRELRLRALDDGHPSPRSPEGAEHLSLPPEWVVGWPRMPDWLGIPRLHASHRAVLMVKNSRWYAQFDWDEPQAMGLFWPGLLPAVGEDAVSPRGDVWLVTERRPSGYRLLRDGITRRVSPESFHLRIWKRAARE